MWGESGEMGKMKKTGSVNEYGNMFLIAKERDIFLFFFFPSVCLYFRETECVWGRGREKKETESEAGSRLRAVSTEPDAGLELTGCEIRDHDLSQSPTLG